LLTCAELFWLLAIGFRSTCQWLERGTLYSVLRCPARSHNGRWFEARQWAILGEPQALRAFCLWLEQGHRSWTSDAPARNIEISAKIPLQDLLGQCQHTDWIGLRLAMLDRPVGTYGENVQWAASGGHPSSLRKSASTRSHSGLWLDIRRCAILRSATGIPPDPPVVRAEVASHPLR